MKFKTILKGPVFDFVKKILTCNFVEWPQPQQSNQDKSHYWASGINYNWNLLFSFFINGNMTINTYFVKMLSKLL